MSNQITTASKAFSSPNIKAKFEELLGKRSVQFVTSVLAVVNNNTLLQKADWESIYQAAITAATLDLPINPNLGFAYIIPYGQAAQFQVGYKGFIQLAQRSGQFKTINASEVREGEIENFDRLTGEIKFNWIQDNELRLTKKIIGYVSYFQLLNGFTKLLYMTIEELEAHGQSFSKSYNSTKKDFNTGKKEYSGLWRTNFDAMAQKTVLKLLLSKYAPLSTQMETALASDQATIEDGKPSYPDNPKDIDNTNVVDVKTIEKTRLQLQIEAAQTTEELNELQEFLDTKEERMDFMNRTKQLKVAPNNATIPETTEDGALMAEEKPTTNA